MPQIQPAKIQGSARFHLFKGSANPGRPRSTHNRGKDVLVSKLHTKPNAKAHDQTMAQWNTECHRNESGMLREARQLTDVNVSGVSPSRERA